MRSSESEQRIAIESSWKSLVMNKSDQNQGGGSGIRPPGPPSGAVDWLCAAVVVATVLAMGLPGITKGGLGWSDAPQHTFDGVFIVEFLKELPIGHVREWAEQFYLRYPALGIFVYWPPGFAVVEAAIFGLFGVSVVTARATVVMFACLAGLMMYALGRRWFDRWTGLLASLLLITCPHGVLWMRDVMLEWPATFWILATVHAYQVHRDTQKARWAAALGVAGVMAFMTKQTAGFILPVLLLHALISRDRREYVPRAAFALTVIASAAVMTAYLTIARQHAALPGELLRPSLAPLFYPQHLPEIMGWPLVPIAMLGLGSFIAAPDRRARGLLLIWLAAWFVFCSLIAAKEPRYFFFALPPLAFAAVRFFLQAARPGEREQRITLRSDAFRVALLIALACGQAYLTRSKLLGQLPDYAEVVADLARRPDADLVLVDAVRDGQFVLDVYRDEAARKRIVPLRASKLLYARAARAQYGYQQFVQGPEDIVNLLDKYGIRYIVIESRLPKTAYKDADPPPRKMLRKLLAEDPRFVPVGRWAVQCDDPAWKGVEIHSYIYPGCPERTTDTIMISFPGMGREVKFRLP